jgi:multidrug efflux system membrane fusion protein
MSKKFVIIVIAGAVIAYYAYGYFAGHSGGNGGMGGAPSVDVAEVIEREERRWNEFSGKLVAVDQAYIRPQVSGIIESVNFKDGGLVNKGDLLFVVDPRPYEAAFQSANALWVLADTELKRAKSLVAGRVISQSDYDQRKNAAEVAKSNLIKAQLELEYTQVKAPISGRISRAEITVGNLVESGPSAPILTSIVSSTPIYADFEIDETNFLKYARAGVTNNKSASEIPVIMQLNDLSREGHVQSFDNRLSATSGTVRVRAVFDNADDVLVSGLFARVKMGGPTRDRKILITDRAVGTDQSKKFVLVVGADNKAEHREVKLGGTVAGLRIVEDGLKAGEKIIVSGLQRVRMPMQPVTPEIVTMDGVAIPAEPAEDSKE